MPHPSSDELLIARLFDLPAADRAGFWQRACADEPALRTRHPEFARLFSAAEISSFDAPASVTVASAFAIPADGMAGVLESALGAADHEAPGVQIGHYKLLQKIGEGGFGSVWMAEQLEPIRRRVALKIVKLGMDTEEVIARFEVERQALALMDHANIARVFDAGATAAGRPFFVMELVRGVAITRYCDDNRLNAEARLKLFVTVCQAVQHAHQKGIIHRDLKPSNILVTLHDGTPVPKVIDFGIAKAIDKQLTDKTLVTHFHAFVGTPAYTSPEQMEMSGLDVDTRSDVYSLGVLLYELLAGRPPFDPDALVKSGLEAMRRTLREIDPPRPSHRLGTLNDVDRTSVAHARSTDATKLSLLLRGDVDWIVMHCLEKDRTRRYETANALARDVERHLANEPVSARPPSTLYRTQKLFRRHKLAVTATAAVAASLVVGVIVSSTLFVREHAARTRAVAAEKSEEKLRQQAEIARTEEARRASRTSFALAEQMLSDGRTSGGLAHLVRAARSDAANTAVGPRLISTLAFRSFAEPIGEPLPHLSPVRFAYYSKDGRRCVTVAEDRHLRTWDLAGGRLLQDIDNGEPTHGDLSPDGTLSAVAGVDRSINVWNVTTGRKVLGPLRHEQRVSAVRFSPDGRLLASGSADGTTRIWSLETGETEAVLRHATAVQSISFSSDGIRVFTTAVNGPWRIWRLPGGEPVTPYIENGVAFRHANAGTFSPDGKLVAVVFNGRSAQLFDAATGTAVGAPMPHDGPSYQAVFTSDGKKLVTTSDDAKARVWEVPTGKALLPPLPGSSSHPVRLTPDSRHLLTGSGDGVARVWDLATGRLALEPIRVGDVQAFDVAPDGTEFLTGGRDGTLRRWRLAPGAAVPLLFSRTPERKGVQREPGNTAVVSVIERDRIQKVDLLTGRTVGPPRQFPLPIGGLNASSPDGRRLAVTISGERELWDLSGAEISRLRIGRLATGSSASPTFSADGTHFASIEGTALRVWDAGTGKLVAGPFPGVSRIAFTPDSRRLVFGVGETVQIWDFATGRSDGEPLPLRGKVNTVAFSPDGGLIALGAHFAQLWDFRTRRPVGPPLPHRDTVRGAPFSRDGRRLLTYTPRETRVWDVATGAPLTDPMVGGTDIFHGGFSDDGTRVVTWSRTNGEVRLWDSTSGQLLAEPFQGPRAGSNLPPKFLSFDRFISRETGGGGLVVWAVPPPSGPNAVPDWLLRLATAVAGGEIDARAVFREQGFDAKAFDAIRRELAALPATAPYVEWGRWILADRATRSIAPGFTITAAEAVKFGGPQVANEPTVDDP